MIWLRALAFNLAFYGMTLALGVLYLPLLAAPRAVMRRAGAWWARAALALLEGIVGVRVELRGTENVPPGPAIFAAKHQSAWDTLFFPAWLGDPAVVAKRELRLIPLYGWYAWRAGMVWVDRAGRARALRLMIRGALDALGEGRAVVVFPEGTRTAPGARRPYHPGIAALYVGTAAPVVPVALNSGLVWGRRAFVKRPGTITVEFLPPMPRGLARAEFLTRLSDRIEAATRRLEAEAQGVPPPNTDASRRRFPNGSPNCS